MASQQLYQLLANNPLTATLGSITPLQPDDAGATEMGATTYQDLCIALGIPITVKVSLTSAEILQLNSTPKILVAAPGAGKVIRPIGQVMKLNYNSSPYSGNAMTALLGGNIVFTQNSYLSSSNAYDMRMQAQFGTAVDLENLPLTVTVTSANPTGGNSSIDLYITYAVISL